MEATVEMQIVYTSWSALVLDRLRRAWAADLRLMLVLTSLGCNVLSRNVDLDELIHQAKLARLSDDWFVVWQTRSSTAACNREQRPKSIALAFVVDK